MAIDWPDADEVKQVLDITSEDWDDTIDRVTAAAIAKVKSDVGKWDEMTDTPDENMAQAALRMAELIGVRESSPESINDQTYNRLLTGRRRRFAVG